MSSPRMPIFEPIKLILKGGVIGVANIIPGVSGGTMAVVFGIYEELIEAIGNFATRREKRRDYAVFLFKVALGAITMVVSLSWLVDFLLTNYRQPTYLFTDLLVLHGFNRWFHTIYIPESRRYEAR